MGNTYLHLLELFGTGHLVLAHRLGDQVPALLAQVFPVFFQGLDERQLVLLGPYLDLHVRKALMALGRRGRRGRPVSHTATRSLAFPRLEFVLLLLRDDHPVRGSQELAALQSVLDHIQDLIHRPGAQVELHRLPAARGAWREFVDSLVQQPHLLFAPRLQPGQSGLKRLFFLLLRRHSRVLHRGGFLLQLPLLLAFRRGDGRGQGCGGQGGVQCRELLQVQESAHSLHLFIGDFGIRWFAVDTFEVFRVFGHLLAQFGALFLQRLFVKLPLLLRLLLPLFGLLPLPLLLQPSLLFCFFTLLLLQRFLRLGPLPLLPLPLPPRTHPGIQPVRQVDKLVHPPHLCFPPLLSQLCIVLLDPTSLVPTLRLLHVLLVRVWKLPPRLERKPERVKPVHHVVGRIQRLWKRYHRLLDAPF